MLISSSSEWDLLCYIDPSPHARAQPFALLVLNYPIRDSVNFRNLWKRASHRVAADGGANRLAPFFESLDPPTLDAIVGDLDSATQRTRGFFASSQHPPQVVCERDQGSTDFAKGVAYIRSCWPGVHVVALGGIGGRIDQGFAVMHHMYLLQREQHHDMSLTLVGDGNVTVLLSPGKHSIRVKRSSHQDTRIRILEKSRRATEHNGDAAVANVPDEPTSHIRKQADFLPKHMHVGIIPMRKRAVLTTQGLHWDVQSWTTEIGGQVSTSNRVAAEAEVVHVETSAAVLFTVHLYDDGE